MRRAFLAVFFGFMTTAGLSQEVYWPFYSWDMWDRLEPASIEKHDLVLVDAAGKEWRYDVSAVPPTSPAFFKETCGRILLEQPDKADSLATWLLTRARKLRDDPVGFRPRWWATDFGFLPVGPAARESCAGWSREMSEWPAEFVEVIVRRHRIVFSTRDARMRREPLEEKRFPWTGS